MKMRTARMLMMKGRMMRMETRANDDGDKEDSENVEDEEKVVLIMMRILRTLMMKWNRMVKMAIRMVRC
jgi:hypothetical protein